MNEKENNVKLLSPSPVEIINFPTKLLYEA